MRISGFTAALLFAAGVGAGCLVQGYAVAQQSHTGHTMAAPADKGSAAEAFAKINADMHAAMNIKPTGDADVDFVKGMIPHHEGAVAMARVVLQHGKDPVVRRLAEEIISSQETEITLMKAWLAKKGQ